MIVGGGRVASRRAAWLVEAGAEVTVIAPQVVDELAKLPVKIERRPFSVDDLAGAFIVVIATDDPDVNAQATEAARESGALVNRVDNPDACDIFVPAHRRVGPITLTVSTGGMSARAGADILDQLRGQLDGDWVTLLGIVEPFRKAAQRQIPNIDLRHEAMRRLVEGRAMRVLKEDGQEALADYFRAILQEYGESTA